MARGNAPTHHTHQTQAHFLHSQRLLPITTYPTKSQPRLCQTIHQRCQATSRRRQLLRKPHLIPSNHLPTSLPLHHKRRHLPLFQRHVHPFLLLHHSSPTITLRQPHISKCQIPLDQLLSSDPTFPTENTRLLSQKTSIRKTRSWGRDMGLYRHWSAMLGSKDVDKNCWDRNA